MFIVELNYLTTLDEVDKYVQAHRDYLDTHYKSGLFLASGPMNPRTGGIIIVTGNDQAGLEQILQQDPYYQAKIADYKITAFTAVKCREELKALL